MKTHAQTVALNIASSLYEIASRMEGLGKYMQACEDQKNMVLHGREIEDAAMIAVSWAIEIEKEHEIRCPDHAKPNFSIALEAANAMKLSSGGLGDKVMNFIIESGLLSTECPDSPESGCVTVWSANSAEQIEACIADLARQGTVPCPLCGQSQNQP